MWTRTGSTESVASLDKVKREREREIISLAEKLRFSSWKFRLVENCPQNCSLKLHKRKREHKTNFGSYQTHKINICMNICMTISLEISIDFSNLEEPANDRRHCGAYWSSGLDDTVWSLKFRALNDAAIGYGKSKKVRMADHQLELLDEGSNLKWIIENASHWQRNPVSRVWLINLMITVLRLVRLSCQW